MSNTANQLTADEICRIIKISAKAKVASLKIGDLLVEFSESEQAHSDRLIQRVEPTTPAEAALSEIEHDKQMQEAIEYEELITREDQLDLMLIENPLEAEKMILNGEVETEEGLDEETLD
jgi:hypothetical protein